MRRFRFATLLIVLFVALLACLEPAAGYHKEKLPRLVSRELIGHDARDMNLHPHVGKGLAIESTPKSVRDTLFDGMFKRVPDLQPHAVVTVNIDHDEGTLEYVDTISGGADDPAMSYTDARKLRKPLGLESLFAKSLLLAKHFPATFTIKFTSVVVSTTAEECARCRNCDKCRWKKGGKERNEKEAYRKVLTLGIYRQHKLKFKERVSLGEGMGAIGTVNVPLKRFGTIVFRTDCRCRHCDAPDNGFGLLPEEFEAIDDFPVRDTDCAGDHARQEVKRCRNIRRRFMTPFMAGSRSASVRHGNSGCGRFTGNAGHWVLSGLSRCRRRLANQQGE